MKGLASEHTLTGKVQRALSGQWQTQAEIMRAAGLKTPGKMSDHHNVAQCLQRLVREKRAMQAPLAVVNSHGMTTHYIDVYRRVGPT